MSISRVSAIILGTAAVAFLGIFGYGRYTDWRERNRTDWQRKYETAQDSLTFYRKGTVRDSIVYVTRTVPQYIHVRDSVIRDPKTPPSTKEAYKACDVVLSACDSIQAKLRGQIRGLEYENDLLKHKPGPPRLVAYGDALYDAVGMRPVVRVGGELRVVGPLHLKVEGEYAVPSAMKQGKGDGFRVLAGVRINFNR